MPPRSRKGYTDLKQLPHSYSVMLSCQHDRLLPKPLPAIGDASVCGSCGPVTVVGVDERELEVYCQDCRRGVGRFHIKATLSAGTKAAVHGIREKPGHKATVREVGLVLGTP